MNKVIVRNKMPNATIGQDQMFTVVSNNEAIDLHIEAITDKLQDFFASVREVQYADKSFNTNPIFTTGADINEHIREITRLVTKKQCYNTQGITSIEVAEDRFHDNLGDFSNNYAMITPEE